MKLFIVLLIVVTVFLLLIKLIAALTGRVSERLLTRYFRDLEAIVEHDTLPATWENQLRLVAHGRRMGRRFGSESDVQGSPREEVAKSLLIEKIRRLQNYFEGSPFVESPEARELLLEKLEAVAKRWQESDLSEILAHYDVTIGVNQGHK